MTTTIPRPEILTRRPQLQPGAVGTGTLCLFRGPTPWVDPARKLVTPLDARIRHMDDQGNKAQWWDAGMVHRALMAEVGVKCNGLDNCCLVHDKTIQHSRDGVKVHTLIQETPAQRYLRRVPEGMSKAFPLDLLKQLRGGIDSFDDEPLADLDLGYVYAEAPQGLWVSPSLYDEVGEYFGADAFPEAFDFGNGATCNSWVPLQINGEVRPTLLCWAIMPADMVSRYGSDTRFWERVRCCVEGGQTGAAIPGSELAPLPEPDCNHDWKPINPEFPYFKGCPACGAIKVGRNSVITTESYVQLQVATAPANPSAGFGRIYAAVDAQPKWLGSGGVSTNMYGGGTSVITRAGGQLNETTSTSTTVVDLTTMTVSIAADLAFYGVNDVRKVSGGAGAAGWALKLNTTIVSEAVITTESFQNVCGVVTSTDANEQGFATWHVKPVVTNHTFGGVIGTATSWRSLGEAAGSSPIITRSVTGNRPNATITAVVIRFISGRPDHTCGFEECSIYQEANA